MHIVIAFEVQLLSTKGPDIGSVEVLLTGGGGSFKRRSKCRNWLTFSSIQNVTNATTICENIMVSMRRPKSASRPLMIQAILV